jgi:hypothetical protein
MSGTRPARGRLTDGRARRDGRQLGAEPCSARKTLRRRPGAARSLLTTRRGQKCAPADSCSCAGRSSERFRVLAASLLLRRRWGRNPSAPLADSADLKEKLELEAFWCGRLRARRAQAFEVGAELVAISNAHTPRVTATVAVRVARAHRSAAIIALTVPKLDALPASAATQRNDRVDDAQSDPCGEPTSVGCEEK